MRLKLQEHEKVTSTNDLAKRAIEEGAEEGLAICAREQTAGRGRQGRSWLSPEGGLYLSLVLRPRFRGNFQASHLPTLAIAMALAAREALAEYIEDSRESDATEAPSEFRNYELLVKWPNDIVVEKPGCLKKLAGILIEKHEDALAVGIGVNVDKAPIDTAIGLADAIPEVRIGELRSRLLETMQKYYEEWLDCPFDNLRQEFGKHDALSGHHVQLKDIYGELMYEGSALGIDEAGLLVISDDNGQIHRISSGEAHVGL